ncbi:DUF6809 family protein [Pseudoflavonifractor phocaeensis]|uniref:DUF6809 family protein n=1 Tax=Pseudoflavonifractor phocaeensis TaxID=1870988 RepID=UPI001958BF4F|nr:DUF6809 family protein [Pseudoflavonifractor phocaeensis]MBM6927333.1 hypothetical protein [Pseudoflavonifractor phocaeensis]
MSILEEFWYGNIEPAEYDSCATKEYRESLRQHRIIRQKEPSCQDIAFGRTVCV